MFCRDFQSCYRSKIYCLVVATAIGGLVIFTPQNAYARNDYFQYNSNCDDEFITYEELTHPFRGITKYTPLRNCAIAYNYFENNIKQYCEQYNNYPSSVEISMTDAFIQAQNYIHSRNPNIPLRMFPLLLKEVCKVQGVRCGGSFRADMLCIKDYVAAAVQEVSFVDSYYMNDDMVVGALMIVGAVCAQRIPGVGILLAGKLFCDGYDKVVIGYNKLPPRPN